MKLDAQRQHSQDQPVRRRHSADRGRWTWSLAPTAPCTSWNGAPASAATTPTPSWCASNSPGRRKIVSADFDENGVVDGADFLRWQRGLGIPGGATRSDGDANVDGRVDAVDLGVWKSAFANPAQPSAATRASRCR